MINSLSYPSNRVLIDETAGKNQLIYPSQGEFKILWGLSRKLGF